jgi:hypothetical protein
MIEWFCDEEGNIQAVIGYMVFDDKGLPNDDGEVLYVSDMFVNKAYRHKNMVRYFAHKIKSQFPNIKRAVWFRDIKYKDNKLREFNFNNLLRR